MTPRSWFLPPFLLCLACCLAAPAAEWLSARVDYSDGSQQECELQPIGDGMLVINTNLGERGIPRRVSFKDILELRQEVEESRQTNPWMYAESGKNVRVQLSDESYPLLNFATTLLLTSGETLRGHLISAALRCRSLSGGDAKLFLKRQIKGKPGQTAADLRFPLVVRMTGNAPAEAKPIAGRIPEAACGQLRQLLAIDLERKVVLQARIAPGGAFDFPPMLPGRYELYAVTSQCLLAGFPAAQEVPSGLQENFRRADDFFNDRVILRRNGQRTLVWKQRRDFYDSEKYLHGGVMRHLEVWNWHQAGDEWKLDSRNLVARLMQQGDEEDRRLLAVSRFSNVAPGATIDLTPEELSEQIHYPPPNGQ